MDAHVGESMPAKLATLMTAARTRCANGSSATRPTTRLRDTSYATFRSGDARDPHQPLPIAGAGHKRSRRPGVHRAHPAYGQRGLARRAGQPNPFRFDVPRFADQRPAWMLDHLDPRGYWTREGSSSD